MIGNQVSHYKILNELGRGGMGVVYRAEDTKLRRTVALKFLPDRVSSSATDKARFLQEAQAAAGLNHPNICTVYGVDEHEGHLFISMECVEGGTLRSRLPFPKFDEAIAVAIQIGDALHEAHARGIVHRDIKSDNIMLSAKGQAKVMDFGLAKLKGSLNLTRSSSTLGTLAYMAPEQIQGGEADARSDIFSLGVVLFEMLTGKLPFKGEHEAAVMYSILNSPPESLRSVRPDTPAEFERILLRALEKDPADRYQHVDDLVSELRRFQKQTARVQRPTEPVTPPVVGASTQRISGPTGRSGLGRSNLKVLASVIGGVVVVGCVAAYLFLGRSRTIDSLAVLPFEDTGATPEQEYVADGITESIINNLTKISSLRVVPRSTVFRLKGKDLDLQEIGAKLNVSAVLTGKITHRGDILDVQVDLIDVGRESQLWGNRYQLTGADLLTLQENITGDVSQRLGIGLTEEVREKLSRPATVNTQAYQLYLQGRYYWNKRTAAGLERAIAYFQQAITLDSTYALAYSGLADSYIIQSQYAGIPARITVPLTQAAARKALALDNSIAEPHTSLAFSLFEEAKFEEAETEFKRSLQLNPRYPTTYHWYGIMLGRRGEPEQYLSLLQQAKELDPFSPVITLNVGAATILLGRMAEALPYFRKSVELDSGFAVGYAWAGLTLLELNHSAEALPLLQKSVELSGRSSECLSYLGYYHGKMGNRDEALKLVREEEARYRSSTGAAYNVARIYAAMGEKGKAVEWLRKDYADWSTWITSLATDFTFAGLRSEPEFTSLVQQIRAGKK
jgi:eukaryotic-like serine/threonine-protein kinase